MDVEPSHPLVATQPTPNSSSVIHQGTSVQTRPPALPLVTSQSTSRGQGASQPTPIVPRRSPPPPRPLVPQYQKNSTSSSHRTFEDPIRSVTSSSGTNAVLQPSTSTNEQITSSQPTILPTQETDAPGIAVDKLKRKSAKARGKQKAIEPAETDDATPAPRKRKRKAKSNSGAMQTENDETATEHDGDQDVDGSPPKKRRRSSKSGTPATPSPDSPKTKQTRPRKSKDIDIDRPIPSNAPQTIDAEGNGHVEDPLIPLVSLDNPGDPLDPTSTTMASLCDDPGVGHISNRFFETRSKWRVYKQRRKEEDRELRMLNRRRELGEKVDEDEAVRRQRLEDRAREKAREKEANTSAAEGEEDMMDEEGEEDDEYAGIQVKKTMFAPQVRFDPVTGETIIDEDSLAVDREKAAAMEEGERVVVVETDREFSNSRSYAKKSTGERWSKEETAMFYDVSDPFPSVASNSRNILCRPSLNMAPTLTSSPAFCLVGLDDRFCPNSKPRIVAIQL